MRMKNKFQIELQSAPPNSSTNMLNMSGMASPRELVRLDSMPSNYQSLNNKAIRVGISLQQSALPPSGREYSFFNLSPYILFSVLRQLHVLYLIVMSMFLMYKYCEHQWRILLVQVCLTLAYICIQIFGRYFTFKYYTKPQHFNDANYYYWNKQHKSWHSIQEESIKVGQIIKIQRKNSSPMEESQQVQQGQAPLKVRVPVNILPMRVVSGAKSVSIQTFDTDKQQATTKIPLIKNFHSYFLNPSTEDGEISYVMPKILEDCLIQYTFSNPVSQSFEATVSFLTDSVEKQISNDDTIPRGAYFCNEKQLIGVALHNLQQKNFRHLKHLLGSRNSIATLLQKHLIIIILCNVAVSILLLGFNALVTIIQINTTFHNLFHCYFFDYFSLLYFSMNVVMYIILGLHQIIDSFLIKKKCNVHMNNYIKSVDEFGVADTFVMDQFSFVKKNILQVSSIELNQQQAIKMFDQQMILIMVERSTCFQSKFQNQWLSLTHYYRSKYGRGSSQKNDSMVINEQKIDMSGSIRLIISLKERQFIVRFNQKIIFSVLQSISIQKQLKFSQKILQGKQNGELMLMVEVLQIKGDYGVDISVVMYELQFKFLCLIKLKFIPHSKAVDFLRYLKNKYKIIIMTSSPFEYFQKILVSAIGLKNQKDYLMVFQQLQESDFQKQLSQKIEEYKKNKFKSDNNLQERYRKGSFIYSDENNAISTQKMSSNVRKTVGNPNNEQEKGNDLILALHSSLIIYLGRPKIKDLLIQLSKISTYIIFYNCSQFQKQLCAASVFKIFPQHIFLSNFAIDANIFRISNLSVCITRHSAQRYTTATASSYQSLQKFISKECVTSIQLTTIIIKTHIFKNQCFVWSMMTASLLIFRSHYMFIGQQYSDYILFFYNAAFTMLPIIYYLIARPGLVGDIMVQDYKDYKLRYEHFKGILSGILLAFLTYCIVPEEIILQVYFAVLVNCTLISNFYHLVIDDSEKKIPQIIIIIIQCALSIGVYFITALIYGTHQMFTYEWSMTPDIGYQAIYFCTVFALNPLIIIMLLFFMSFHKSILVKDRRIEKKQLEDQQIKSSIKKEEIVARVGKSIGKQMRFRGLDARPQYF